MEFRGVEEQQEIGDAEAQREDMGWGQRRLKQQLGEYEGATPDGHDDEG